MKALETTGTIEKSGKLKLDKPVNISGKVRVIILYGEDVDIDGNEWINSLNTNPSFSFLKHKKEDIYTLSDGKPFKR